MGIRMTRSLRSPSLYQQYLPLVEVRRISAASSKTLTCHFNRGSQNMAHCPKPACQLYSPQAKENFSIFFLLGRALSLCLSDLPLGKCDWLMSLTFSFQSSSDFAHQQDLTQLITPFLKNVSLSLWDNILSGFTSYLTGCYFSVSFAGSSSCPRCRIGKHGPWASCPFLESSIVEHSHTHSFICCLWLFLCYKGKVKSLQQRIFGPQSQKYSLSGPLKKKSANS